MGGKFKFTNYDNFIYRVTLNNLPKNIDTFFGDSGLFFEYHINNLDNINHILKDRYQTLTYYGVEKKIILEFLKNLNSNSIDRIVPIGKALDIGLIWDGYDIIRILSRKTSIFSLEKMTLDLKGIHDYQQNRSPYLLIDYANEVIPGKSAKGYKDLVNKDWWVEVHFPNDPNMPGVLQVEAIVQLGALMVTTLPGNKGQ